MAEELDKKVGEFNNELNKISVRIQDLGEDLGINLVGKLNDSVNAAKRLSDPLKDATSITKELNKLADKNETLIIQRKVAEESYVAALKKGKNELIKTTEEKFRQLNSQLKITIALDNQLRKLESIAEEEERVTKEKAKQLSFDNLTKKSRDGISSYFEKLLGFSFSLTGIFTLILKAAFDIDSQIVELGRSLGISKEQAKGIREEFYQYAQSIEDGFTTTKKLLQAQSDLSKQLGIAVKFNKEDLKTFAKLTELYGSSSEEAGKLSKLSAVTGKSVEQYKNSILKGSFYAQQATKTHFDQREILKDVANLSAGILVKFRGNPEALSRAVVEAKKLGTNLATIDKIGESLLNWESSIENELKAELLTGKQINLEKARYAALTGNQLDLTREIASQVGTLNDFENLNVIAQKSLAEAFGLSKDEMAEMLLQQETINKYGDKAAKLNAQELEDLSNSKLSLDEYLSKQAEQLKIQDRFNTAMENLKDVIGTIASGPLMNLLDGFATLLKSTTLIKSALIAITAISFSKTLASLATMAASLGISAAGAIASASAISFGIGMVAIIAGIAAAMSAFSSAKDEASQPKFARGGIVTSEINNATIGEAGPEAIIPLNSLRANNILGNNNNAPSMDLNPMVTIMSEVKASIDRLYSKNTTISMDGKAVGTTLTQGSYKFA
jgi:hypothetical protein